MATIKKKSNISPSPSLLEEVSSVYKGFMEDIKTTVKELDDPDYASLPRDVAKESLISIKKGAEFVKTHAGEILTGVLSSVVLNSIVKVLKGESVEDKIVKKIKGEKK